MAPRADTTLDHRARIARVLRRLEQSLDQGPDQSLTIDALAREAAYAKHHFHRVFRGVTGESVAGYLRRLRLERAARRLRHGGVTVTDAALEAGFTAPEAFTRAFTQHFGVPPAAYKGEPSPRVAALDPAQPAPPVDVRHEPAVPVLALRTLGSYAAVGQGFAALMGAAARSGLLAGPPRLYGLCHDDPDITAEHQLRFDACLAVLPGTPAAGDVAALTPREVPAGRYAVALHRGPYTTLSQTYLALIGRWLPATTHALCDEPVVEVYLDDPGVTAPEQLRTEVRVRLQR
jgi:AraC family transcriptional regulator